MKIELEIYEPNYKLPKIGEWVLVSGHQYITSDYPEPFIAYLHRDGQFYTREGEHIHHIDWWMNLPEVK